MAKIKEVEIISLGQLIDEVMPSHRDPNSGRFRDTAIYRGTADSSWNLLSSLDRLGGVRPPYTKIHLEKDIARSFNRYSHPFLSNPNVGTWELMVIGQHHGLPTRLLDWSYSPLVAAHFATLEDSTESRVVWKFEWKKAHEAFDIQRRALLVDELDKILQRRGITDPFQLFQKDSLGEDDFVALLDPPSLDARLVAQSGTFTICSQKGVPLDTFLIRHGLEDALIKYIIPKEKVDAIRDQLDLCSVDERRLFPDLDGVAKERRRFYSYSPAEE